MIKKSIVVLVAATLMPCGISVAQTASNAYGAGAHQYFSGRHQEAILSFNSAIAENPNDARAFYFRGLAQIGSGNSYAADADFQQGASVETSARQRRSSLVSRSLERIQGSTRLRIERFRGTMGSPAIAGGTFTEGPVPTSAPVGGIAYGAPIEYAAPIHYNQAVMNQGYVSPAPCIAQPIYQQPIYQQPIVINAQPVLRESIRIESPIENVNVAVEPVPEIGQVDTFTFDGPVTSAAPIIVPDQATLETKAPPAQAGGAISEAPSVEPVLSGSEAKSAAQAAVREPTPVAPVEVPTAVEASAIDNPAEVPTPTTQEDPFGAETKPAIKTDEEPGPFEIPNENLPGTEPAASDDVFGTELPNEEKPTVIEEPAVIKESAATDEPATSEELVNEADPFGAATPESEPIPTQEPAPIEEPLDAEPLTEEPASEADPFGAELPASDPAPTKDPAPIEEPAAEEPASEADPFGAETPTIEEPAAEVPANESDPFGAESPTIEEPAAEEPASEADPFGAETPTIEEPAGEEPAGDPADPFG